MLLLKSKPLPITAYMKQTMTKKTFKQYIDPTCIEGKYPEFASEKYVNSLLPKPKKNPTKTFIGGVVCTLAVIYIIFPLADYLTDTLLAYLMK
jgi:hypothetical protein